MSVRHGSAYPIRSALALCLAAPLLSGCGDVVARLADVGKEPAMTQIQNPVHSPNYHPVSLPMPQAAVPTPNPNSLWRPGARGFFKDQRASRVGDILTVNISIADSAVLDNTTSRARDNSENSAANALLGFEQHLSSILPKAVDNTNLVDLTSTSSSKGTGSVDRKETINLKVAAVITQRLPNGNLVLAGRQEVRVNFEVRQLQIMGVIRPEDIKADNTISYEKIAEARISYGGKGQITDVQQPRYGQQIYDILWPF
jgi:flagellar L-ring protein precursor FlgH